MDEDPSQSGQNLWRPATQAGYQPANQNAQQGYIHPEHNTPPPFQEPQAQAVQSSFAGQEQSVSQPGYVQPDHNERLISGSDNFRTDSPESFQGQQMQAFNNYHFQQLQQIPEQQAVYQSVPTSFDQTGNQPSSPSPSFQQFQTLTPEGARVLQHAQVLQGFALQLQGLPTSTSEASSSQLLHHMTGVTSSALTEAPSTAVTEAGEVSMLAQSSSSSVQMMPPSSLAPYMVETLTDKPSNSSEATAVIMQHGHLVSHDPDESVSSLTISLREHHRPSGDDRSMEVDSTAEPDTTQDDGAYDNMTRGEINHSQIKPSTSVEINGLHSTVDDADIQDESDQDSESEVSEESGSEEDETSLVTTGVDEQSTVDQLINLVNRSHANIPDIDAVVSKQNVMNGLNEEEIPSSSGLQASLMEDENKSELVQPVDQSQQSQLRSVYMLMPTESSTPAEGNQKEMRVRRSGRIALMDMEQTIPQKPVYQPRSYNPNQLWCEECQMAYDMICPIHHITEVPDKVVLSRAWASLPNTLEILRFEEGVGVFTKKLVAPRTQFGPFVADMKDTKEQLTKQDFLLQVEVEGKVSYLEAVDEHLCNWMMFVRPATCYKEQNMIAHQYGNLIYYTTVKPIEPKHELRVWYAAHYAHHIGASTYQLSEEDREELGQLDYRWQCYECNKKFRTSALLQKHIITHDDTNASGAGESDDSEFSHKDEFPRKRKPGPKPGSKKGKEPEMDGQVKYINWKKRTSSLYLNKYKKMKKGEPKSIRSMYQKKRGRDGVKEEWMCTHCDLTFDTSSLLNLHTLTHAAEDVGLEEIRKLAEEGGEGENRVVEGSSSDLNLSFGHDASFLHNHTLNIIVPDTAQKHECPVCNTEFNTKKELIDHAATHGRAKRNRNDASKPHKCDHCHRGFITAERLEQHVLIHGSDDQKPLPCQVCSKRFLNNSALACHMKTHSDKKYYQCVLCTAGFDQAAELKCHMQIHCIDGNFTCPECGKVVNDVNLIKKHMRTFHSEKQYPCPHCDKILPRPDKLKLHLLKHSDHREFMCESCGRQFKRKDKLKEHKRRMHSAEREAKKLAEEMLHDSTPNKKFVPKVSPHEYHRFIYKCHQCLIGFKRRGMLVNHLAKQHPDVKPESVPELNLPILKTQRDYYCQYCDKIYKSSSKRKAHIVKNHPGAELPMSGRKLDSTELTFSATVGSVTTVPHPCIYCHKQYASKAKLLQHQRKKHPEVATPPPEKRRVFENLETTIAPEQQVAVVAGQSGGDVLPTADLLTQAMSELTQTLNEYHQQEFNLAARSQASIGGNTAPTIIHALPTVNIPITQTTTLELSHLGQALAQGQFSGGAVQITPPTQTSQSDSPQPAIVTNGQIITTQVQQPNGQVTQIAYQLPKSWANANFQFK